MSYHKEYSIPDTRSIGKGISGQFHDMETPAVLLIFEPNRRHALGDHHHRSLLYNFDDRFLNNAYRLVDVGSKSGGDTNELVTDVLRDRSARDAIGAPIDPDCVINLGFITERWRFVLIINKPKAPTFGGYAAHSPLVHHRVIMNGYFDEDPFMRRSNALNYDASMVFTHKTVIEMADIQGPSRRRTSRIDTRFDALIVDPAVRLMADRENLFYTDPDASFMGSYDDAGGNTIARPSREQQVGYRDQAKSLDSRNCNPDTNLRGAITTALSARREVEDRGAMSHLYNESGLSNIPYARESNYRSAFARHISSRGDTSQILGYDENEHVTISQLDRDYTVRVQRVDSDQSGQFDLMDGGLPTANNVFCSILAEAIPTLMTASGLLRLDFRFDSFYDRSGFDADPYRFGIEFVTSIIPEHDRTVMDKACSIIREMDRGVFRTVHAGHGDFNLIASVDITGLTFLKLHFVQDDQRYQEPYEHPTIFSGLITNQFGSPESAQINANQMARFVGAVTSTDSDYDDRDLILPGDNDRRDDRGRRYSDADDVFQFPDLGIS